MNKEKEIKADNSQKCKPGESRFDINPQIERFRIKIIGITSDPKSFIFKQSIDYLPNLSSKIDQKEVPDSADLTNIHSFFVKSENLCQDKKIPKQIRARILAALNKADKIYKKTSNIEHAHLAAVAELQGLSDMLPKNAEQFNREELEILEPNDLNLRLLHAYNLGAYEKIINLIKNVDCDNKKFGKRPFTSDRKELQEFWLEHSPYKKIDLHKLSLIDLIKMTEDNRFYNSQPSENDMFKEMLINKNQINNHNFACEALIKTGSVEYAEFISRTKKINSYACSFKLATALHELGGFEIGHIAFKRARGQHTTTDDELNKLQEFWNNKNKEISSCLKNKYEQISTRPLTQQALNILEDKFFNVIHDYHLKDVKEGEICSYNFFHIRHDYGVQYLNKLELKYEQNPNELQDIYNLANELLDKGKSLSHVTLACMDACNEIKNEKDKLVYKFYRDFDGPDELACHFHAASSLEEVREFLKNKPNGQEFINELNTFFRGKTYN